MNPKEKDNEIIELTDEELDEIFADDDFDNGEEGGEIRSFYFSNPDPYSKDTSRKIRAVNKAKGERGERLTTNIPYGYKRDSDDPKKWVIDEEANRRA